jgi:transcription elongation factor Elf1
VVTKRRPKLSKRFKCPFCANDDTVECKMDFKIGIGSLNCRLCSATYQMPIHHLNEPIDIFSEWLDDCEAAATGTTTTTTLTNATQRSTAPGGSNGRYPEGDDDDDEAIPDASGFAGQRKVSSTNKNYAKNNSNQRSIDLGEVGDSEEDDDDE